jgi:hypothetical protein
MEQDRRPIGYWLKHLDRLIEQTFERTLKADGLTRRHWQVLNSVEKGSTTRSALVLALHPFMGDDAGAVEAVIDDLLHRNWLRRLDDGGLEISEEGRSAHAEVMKRVSTTRQLLRRGISDDDYIKVVAALQRMVSNLESFQE